MSEETQETRSESDTQKGVRSFVRRFFSPGSDAPSDSETGNQTSDEHLTPSFVTYCFSVNYILGVGILNIPWGFNQAGYILAPILLGLVSIISYICANYILETLARAQGHLDHLLAQKDSTSLKRMSINDYNSSNPSVLGDQSTRNGAFHVEEIDPSQNRGKTESIDEERQPFLAPSFLEEPTNDPGSPNMARKVVFNNRIENTLFEMPQLCALYLPRRGSLSLIFSSL